RVTDTTPPRTRASASPHPNAKEGNRTNVTVALSATDNIGGSGIKQISYSLSGAQTAGSVAAGTSTSVTASTAGTTTLTYFATDNAGNQEAARTLTLNIDKTLPTTKASASPSPNANRWHKTDVTVTLSATDNPGGSGVKQINYSLRGA